ncbi:MAG: hypothetical protein J6386_03435 [Candidatus Synoicihabitans palmerolidicus]|nr:hypothetical protein [Candidatus Synoicihabitans palmerolidicus]
MRPTFQPRGILGLAGALPIILAARVVFNEPWAPLAGFGLTVVLGLMAWRARARTALPGAAIALLFGHLSVQLFNDAQGSLTGLWLGALPLAPHPSPPPGSPKKPLPPRRPIPH